MRPPEYHCKAEPHRTRSALAGAAPVQHPHEDPPSATGGSSGSAVTNTAFIKALFSTLPEGQCNAFTNFKDYDSRIGTLSS